MSYVVLTTALQYQTVKCKKKNNRKLPQLSRLDIDPMLDMKTKDFIKSSQHRCSSSWS
jgi:hypothetical protein